jgi:hypothetical protein
MQQHRELSKQVGMGTRRVISRYRWIVLSVPRNGLLASEKKRLYRFAAIQKEFSLS